MPNLISGVYKIVNIINNKLYIGSSVDIKARWKYSHLKPLRENRHCNILLQRAWNKYGEDNFKFEVMHYCFKEELLIIEQTYMDIYNSANPRYGYNLCPTAGNCLGLKASDAARLKMSNTRKGRPCPWLNGRPVTEETKKKMSVSQKKKWNLEMRQRLSDKMLGNTLMIGRKLSEETKKKISEFHKHNKYTAGKKLSHEHKLKISTSLIGNKRSLGHKQSKETIAKRIATRKANKEKKNNTVEELLIND
jgi:group I intron endonuclease